MQSRIKTPKSRSIAVRNVMRANRGVDTGPEVRLRSLVHRAGLRYAIDVRPESDINRRADLVFRDAKVAGKPPTNKSIFVGSDSIFAMSMFVCPSSPKLATYTSEACCAFVAGSHWLEKVVLHPALAKPILNPPTPANNSATLPTGFFGSADFFK